MLRNQELIIGFITESKRMIKTAKKRSRGRGRKRREKENQANSQNDVLGV